MLRAGWSLANSSNILSDLNGEIGYVLRVPRIIPVYRALPFETAGSSLQRRRQSANNNDRTVISTPATRGRRRCILERVAYTRLTPSVGPPAARCRDFDERVSRPPVELCV